MFRELKQKQRQKISSQRLENPGNGLPNVEMAGPSSSRCSWSGWMTQNDELYWSQWENLLEASAEIQGLVTGAVPSNSKPFFLTSLDMKSFSSLK